MFSPSSERDVSSTGFGIQERRAKLNVRDWSLGGFNHRCGLGRGTFINGCSFALDIWRVKGRFWYRALLVWAGAGFQKWTHAGLCVWLYSALYWWKRNISNIFMQSSQTSHRCSVYKNITTVSDCEIQRLRTKVRQLSAAFTEGHTIWVQNKINRLNSFVVKLFVCGRIQTSHKT